MPNLDSVARVVYLLLLHLEHRYGVCTVTEKWVEVRERPEWRREGV